MAAQTGRTVNRWMRFVVDDSNGVLREIPVNSINGIGLNYPAVDITAWQDVVRGVLSSTPECTIEVSGPFDNIASVAASGSGVAPALSGSHTVLYPIVGGMSPLALGVLFGMRHHYETTEPAFGLNYGATSGFICTSYSVDPENSTYTARFEVFAGSVCPSWLNAIPSS